MFQLLEQAELVEVRAVLDDRPIARHRRPRSSRHLLRHREQVAIRELAHELGMRVGDEGLATALRAARRVVALAPFRERGHQRLIEALQARGETAEALRVYDACLRLMRDELGSLPGASLRAAHRRLLGAP